MVGILAIIGGLWVIGRISRQSRNHPTNAIPPLLNQARQVPGAGVTAAYGTSQETAQIQGSLIAGEGGGE